MNSKLLAIVMISGFLFSTSSVYLNHIVFADDNWSDIQKRQQTAEQRAIATYQNKYQFAEVDQTKRNWSGLTSTSTDETSRGRDLDAQATVSLQNALTQFDTIHVKQLAELQSSYNGLTSTPTDMQGRDRNAMIDAAQTTSLNQAEQILGELTQIQANYANFAPGTATDESTYDRQSLIVKNMDNAEAKAADLVNSLAKIDQVYVNLDQYREGTKFAYQSGSVTNEMTHGGRQLTPQEAYALEKAVMIFNQIHKTHLSLLQSNYYGLTSTPTDTEGRDRNAMLEHAKDASMTNALRVYNSYYNGAGLK